MESKEILNTLKEWAIDELSNIETIQYYLLKGSRLTLQTVEINQPHLPFYELGVDVFDIKIKGILAPRGDGPCVAAVIKAKGFIYVEGDTNIPTYMSLTEVKVIE